MGWKSWKITIENCWKEVSLNDEALIMDEGQMKTFLYELSVLLPHMGRQYYQIAAWNYQISDNF